MLYELRIYDIYPGKMQAIHDRFANFTLEIFAKNGMRVTDFWEDMDAGHNRLVYVLEFVDRDDRNQKFEKFASNPDWLKVKSESEKDGLIVEKVESIFMKNVPYFHK